MYDTSWMAAGKCRAHPVSAFFPSDSDGVERAREICTTCPVRVPCVNYAVSNHIEQGIWGGTSARQRLKMARGRRWTSDSDQAS